MLHKAVAHREAVVAAAHGALMANTMAFMHTLYWFDEGDFNDDGYYHLSIGYGRECNRAAYSQDLSGLIKDFVHLETSPFPSPICHLLAGLPQLEQSGSELLASLAKRPSTTDAVIALERFNTELRRYYSGVFPVILVKKRGAYFVVFPKVITWRGMPADPWEYLGFLIDQPFKLSDQPQKDHLIQISKVQQGVSVKWVHRSTTVKAIHAGDGRFDEGKILIVPNPKLKRPGNESSWFAPKFVHGRYTVL